MKEKLLTIREVSQILEVPEKDMIELTKSGEVPYFKVAGEFLRFKKEDITNIKRILQKKIEIRKETTSWLARTREFFYFNDFYIISTIIIIVLLWVIFKD